MTGPLKQKKAKVYEAVAKAAVMGCKIKPGTFAEVSEDYEDVAYKNVCLCGAILVASGVKAREIEDGLWNDWSGENIIRAVAKKLGITVKQAASMNNGFESWDDPDVVGAEGLNDIMGRGVDRAWFKVGKELRELYDGASA